jgi:3-hydroxyisobutyrate dehydrogenase/2-hydroxy-3-oxopropionate reductase
MSQVAVIGVGRMGGAMVGTLARAGFAPVIYNRTRATAETLAEATGATVVDTPADAAAAADVVISILADDNAVRAAYGGETGIASGVRPGGVVLEMATISPATVHEVGALIDDAGGDLVDAPVSGSVSLVESGSLTVMAAGDAASIDKARPVLDALAAKVFHVGSRGAGATTKLAVNSLVHGINAALAEAVVLAERAGVDRATAYEVFAAGAGGAPFVHYKRAAYLEPEEAPVAFSLDLVAKDLDLITGLAEQVGAVMPIANVGVGLTRAAIESGLGDRDMSAIAVHLRSIARDT